MALYQLLKICKSYKKKRSRYTSWKRWGGGDMAPTLS
jgi:hypothetical protein